MHVIDLLKRGDLVFDVGANIGRKTKLFLEQGAKVICIEPQESCIKELESEFNDKIIIVPKALGSSNKIEAMWIASESTLSTFSQDFIKKTKKSRFRNYDWNSIVKVQMTTLDDLISVYGTPNFCKIDVEGYELEVLKGLSRPITYISLEFTPELQGKTFACINYLLTLDKDYLFNYSVGESLLFSFKDWVKKDIIISFLRGINDCVTFGDLYAYSKNTAVIKPLHLT